MRYLLLFVTYFAVCQSITAQAPKKLSSNQIFEKLEKFNFLGTVLYIAAHPDDENTRLISYFSNEVKARTVYLSLTRGDGGQNLIGPEIRESLGVIRTQELLAARNVDGGEQRFSRANDFGYSKHPDETLEIWDKEKVLADVVWAIRSLQPDIIINRFDHRTSGTTHGHHTASAMLSVEAFDLAADPTKYKEQLGYVDIWKPSRLFFNTSWRFYGSHEKFNKANKDKLLSFDIGVYYPQKGMSNNEISALASSQHLCQGFGRLSVRGSENEYVELLKGDFPKYKSNIFSGIDTSWNRVKGGEEIEKIVQPILQNFNFRDPSVHLPDLMRAYKMVNKIEDLYWKKSKEKELTDIIYACAGLYLEASANISATTPNGKVTVSMEVLNRSTADIKLQTIVYHPSDKKEVKNEKLISNNKRLFKGEISLENENLTSPYWLNDVGTIGMYTVKDQGLIGLPNTPRNIKISFELLIEGTLIVFTKDVVYRYAKRAKGELYQPFEVLPKVTASLKDEVLVFATNKSKEVVVSLRAGTDDIEGTVELTYAKGWSVSPKSTLFKIENRGEVVEFKFMVTPPENQSEEEISVIVKIDGEIYDKELIEIAYGHIPTQSVLKYSSAKVVRIDIKKKGNTIGYIQGAGDVVPESLEQIGYLVKRILPENISLKNLHDYDAIVMGIRAYNTVDELQFKQEILLEYVKNGGSLIVQYNTAGRRGVNVGAPYTLNISRDRVTDENAVVTFLDQKHPILNTPNKITTEDFKGWVQERGLYFPNQWSKEYIPILGMNDKGESMKKGSLLVASYGKGIYIYTGLSFFRELPAGVPGAYKLFANLLSYKK
ncbi:PIG-L family deacetylase [Flavicella sp.]|uniref:PIG-L family deacetylase n=1 Tax=Flavicella sp. TaxID=2957742 RepID=UPI0030190DD9